MTISKNPINVSDPEATQQVAGLVQYATTAETTSGFRKDRAISPSTLSGEFTRRGALAGKVQYAEVIISSAEILALRATPKTLVAAQGSGNLIQLVGAVLILDYNSAAYTESADNLAIRYTNGSGALVSQAIEATGFIDQTADTITNALPKIDAIVTATAVNTPLVLHNTGDGEYAAGNSPMRVKIAYIVHATGL